MRSDNPLRRGLAAAAIMAAGLGMGSVALSPSQGVTPPPQQQVAPLQQKKCKNRFPDHGDGYGRGRYSKYTGAKLRKIRRKQTKEALDAHYEICKQMGVPHGIDESRLIDLHQ